MHLIDHFLAMKKLQGLVVSEQNGLSMNQIMFPLVKSSGDSIEFLVIGAPSLASITQLFIKESNWFLFLRQNSSYSNSASITLNLEHFIKVRKG
jgi:hypothetical protein